MKQFKMNISERKSVEPQKDKHIRKQTDPLVNFVRSIQKTPIRLLLRCVVLVALFLCFLSFKTDYETTRHRQPLMKIQQIKFVYNYLVEMDKLNKERVNMDDPRLISLIRNYWIENPSGDPYRLSLPDDEDPSIGQAAFVDNRLKYKEGGFFVECGALDGESRSNTLLFERLRHWNGILIEADPDNYRLLKNTHRKALTINACLSIHPYPIKMRFRQQFNRGRVLEDTWSGDSKMTSVQCFPLYSILLAINVTNVDFFSLDVEGAELQVLKTIPFDKVNITMITAEFKHIKDGGQENLKQFVESKGYSSLIKIQHFNNLANDIIFRKRH